MAGFFGDLLGGIEGLFGPGAQTGQAAAADAMSGLTGANPNTPIETLGPTAFDSLSVDPTTRAAQMAVLDQYQQQIKGNGLDPEAKAQLDAVNQKLAGQATANAEGATESAERRGNAAGGSAAAMRAAGANDANQAATAGEQAAATAFANKNAALKGAAQVGGEVRGQDYGQAAQKAQADDTVSKLNFLNKQQQEQQNYENQLQKAAGYNSVYATSTGAATQQQAAGEALGSAADKLQQSVAGAAGGGGGGMGGFSSPTGGDPGFSGA